MPWESKSRGLHNGMAEKIRQKVVFSLRHQMGRSRGVAQETLRPALGEQKSRFGQWHGGKDSPESGPLAEAPEGQLTQTAGLSLEQSIAGTEASRDAPEGGRGRSVRPALGEQDSRFAQWNGGKDSPESGPLAEAPEERLTQTAGLSLELKHTYY